MVLIDYQGQKPRRKILVQLNNVIFFLFFIFFAIAESIGQFLSKKFPLSFLLREMIVEFDHICKIFEKVLSNQQNEFH